MKWGTPIRLPAPINSNGNEWFPRLAQDDWLYFGSDRPAGMGKTDIWRAEHRRRRIRTAAVTGWPEHHLDGRWWSPRVAAGQPCVVAAGEARTGHQRERAAIGALWSPSGRSLVFSRDLKGTLSGELFVTHFGTPEAWPARCAHADDGRSPRLGKR
jgi:hypothetical protein